MKNTTIALLQSILAFIIIIVNTGLYFTVWLNLNKVNLTVNNEQTENVQKSKNLILISAILHIVFAVIIAIVTVSIVYNKQKLEEHMNILIYLALFLSCILMLASGIVGAIVATNLQCYKTDENIKKAWENASYTAVYGILGVILILLVQAFTRRSEIKLTALNYLTSNVTPPPKYDVFTGRKANLPSVLTDSVVQKNLKSNMMPMYHPNSIVDDEMI